MMTKTKFPHYGFTSRFTPAVQEEVVALLEQFSLVPACLVRSESFQRAVASEVYKSRVARPWSVYELETARDFMNRFVGLYRAKHFRRKDYDDPALIELNFED